MTDDSLIGKLEGALRNSQKAIEELRDQGAPCALWDDIEAANIDALRAYDHDRREIPYNAKRDEQLIEAVILGAKKWKLGSERQHIPRDVAYEIVQEIRPYLATREPVVAGEISGVVAKASDANDGATTSQEGLAAAVAIMRPYLATREPMATGEICYNSEFQVFLQWAQSQGWNLTRYTTEHGNMPDGSAMQGGVWAGWQAWKERSRDSKPVSVSQADITAIICATFSDGGNIEDDFKSDFAHALLDNLRPYIRTMEPLGEEEELRWVWNGKIGEKPSIYDLREELGLLQCEELL